MLRPSDQAKLLLFALLRSTAALGVTGEKASGSTVLRMASTSAAATQQPSTLPNIQLRLARRTDVPSIQRCNLACLPENYNSHFYCAHLRQWPDLAIVAEDVTDSQRDDGKNGHIKRPFHSFPGLGRHSQPEPKIVAYVLGKVDHAPDGLSSNDWDNRLGHVTSLAVLESYRRRGLAQALMKQLHYHLESDGVSACGLHVRMSNKAACRLYQSDGYEVARVIPAYYQDGEDAFFMKKQLDPIPTEPMRSGNLLRDDSSCSDADSIMDVWNEKCWKTGELRLPRQHPVAPADDVYRGIPEEPELLTGTM